MRFDVTFRTHHTAGGVDRLPVIADNGCEAVGILTSHKFRQLAGKAITPIAGGDWTPTRADILGVYHDMLPVPF